MKYIGVVMTFAVMLLAVSVWYQKGIAESAQASSMRDEDLISGIMSLQASNQHLTEEIVALRKQLGELSQRFEKK